jgi:long-chain acyl-CoA synthetase
VGEVLEFVQLSIENDNGEGEIRVKTPTLMKNYFSEWKTGVVLNMDDWFETGDHGKLNQSVLQITGRKKDIIIRGGINISPLTIEDTILKVTEVVECAVIGIEDYLVGERIIAYARISEGDNEEGILSRIYEVCKKELSPIQQPDEVYFIESIPKSTTGKIKKNELKQMYKGDHI